MTHLVVLDNEAVQAMGDPEHPKHRRVMSHIQVVAHRRRRSVPISLVVPTSVRVEAGWDRSSPRSTSRNLLRVADAPLDPRQADMAARIRVRSGVSAADAHIGAVIEAAAGARVSVITSDPHDMRNVAGDAPVTIVTL